MRTRASGSGGRRRSERSSSVWPPPGDRRSAGDGVEIALRTRTISVDPLDQTAWLEIRAEKWIDGEQVATEEHEISMRMYFRDELLLMLGRAGFSDVEVQGGYAGEAPTGDHEFLVYVARS